MGAARTLEEPVGLAQVDAFALNELAELADYPGPTYAHSLSECRRHADRLPEPARADLIAFVDDARARAPRELEELYASTFDSSDECALEVGWHLYGETYQRGVFLVEMRRCLRERGIEEGSELPDHLSHVLRWMARASRREAERLARLAVAPALASVVGALARRRSPWLPLLRALLRALDPEGRAAPARAAARHSFEGGCG